MNENPIEKVCASPHRWLFVAASTLVIALVSFLPQVDVYLNARSERSDLNEQLEVANQMAEQLPKYEELSEERKTELLRLKLHEVEPEQTAELRSWLVSSARQAGCQVRRIDFNKPSSTPWTKEIDVLKPDPKKVNNKNRTPFDLQKHPITLSVTGSPEELRSLLNSLDTDPRVKHTSALDLRPIGRDSQQVQLDLTLWYFALVKAEKVS